MVAEVVDAVIGVDTHRDSHEVEIADPTGTPIATMRIGNDSAGFTQLLAAVAELVPGPRLAVSLEGSRSYGIGLARARCRGRPRATPLPAPPGRPRPSPQPWRDRSPAGRYPW
jgi:hypothetical protein